MDYDNLNNLYGEEMDIVHIASELAPIAKVGGLGDVIYGLAKAQAKKGHKVRIFLPKYDCLDYPALENLTKLSDLSVQESGHSINNTLWSARFHGLELILIEPHHPRGYFHRGKIYGEKDDNDRFLYFCKVASNALENQSPDVVHLHDWPTAGCALFRKDGARGCRQIPNLLNSSSFPLGDDNESGVILANITPDSLSPPREKIISNSAIRNLTTRPKIVFTIHNMQHQGICAPFNLQRLRLTVDEEELRDPKYPDAINLLKAAIHHSDVITTVSPTYAKEVLTSEGGFGLEEYLVKYKKKLVGILNGIDTEYWNPETDPLLIQNYNVNTRAEGKKENKRYVQSRLNLTQDETKPLVVAITRLVPQKGPDLILYGIEKTLALGGQFALLGTTRDPEMERQFKEIKPHPDLAIRLDYNESLSHLLYAASDLFLMPSIFEPCGLSQMIALRYGSVPVVRATGGLKDTIFDGENGFTFTIPDNTAVSSVLERAFVQFKELIEQGMNADLSWDASADKYLKLYEA